MNELSAAAGGDKPSDFEVTLSASVHGLLAAAALHLGDATEDGRRLAAPDPLEAWRAILAAHALVERFAERLPAEAAQAIARLTERLAAQHPDREFPVPAALLSGGAA